MNVRWNMSDRWRRFWVDDNPPCLVAYNNRVETGKGLSNFAISQYIHCALNIISACGFEFKPNHDENFINSQLLLILSISQIFTNKEKKYLFRP